MPRVALKIAYYGTAFHGQARQPGLRTVEGEVIRALVRARDIRDARSARLQSASRTDRGVSALGNVIAFDTTLAPDAAARALNSKAKEVWAWAAAAVDDDFSARKARERWYRYTLSGDRDPVPLGFALATFVGEHDFRNFTRDRSRTVARIDSATAAREGDAVVLDFRAPSFRWNLVRRLVAAALEVGRGRVRIADLHAALETGGARDFGLAAPEPLCLVDVAYDVEFVPVDDSATLARTDRLLAEALRRSQFLSNLRRSLSIHPPP